MHAFLDGAGIYQINIKDQMKEEQKSVYSASPSLKISHMRAKKPSPSFIERRRQRLLSTMEQQSTAGSSTGAKSQSTVQPTLALSTANFSGDFFGRSTLTKSSVPKSVEEEPNSGDSTDVKKAPALNIAYLLNIGKLNSKTQEFLSTSE